MAPVTFIATTTELASLLATLQNLPTSPPSLYIDLEGSRLSRNGTISLFTIHVLPQNMTYIIDIHNLGASTFSTPASSPTITEPVFILESKTIPKVFFDVRNDSDALFAHYAISLHCITDLQLMELATTRRPSRDYLTGLSKCIDYDSGISLSERLRAQRIKSQGTRLYAPEQGGFYNVFIKRPLKDDIREYCVHDVLHMPALWRAYNARIGAFWREMVREGSEKRVHESWGKEYVPQGEHKKFGCWSRGMIARARKRWDTGARSGLMDT